MANTWRSAGGRTGSAAFQPGGFAKLCMGRFGASLFGCIAFRALQRSTGKRAGPVLCRALESVPVSAGLPAFPAGSRSPAFFSSREAYAPQGLFVRHVAAMANEKSYPYVILGGGVAAVSTASSFQLPAPDSL